MKENTMTIFSHSRGICLSDAVFLVFLVLKLAGIEPVALWSWWWVTAPLWGSLLLAITMRLAEGKKGD